MSKICSTCSYLRGVRPGRLVNTVSCSKHEKIFAESNISECPSYEECGKCADCGNKYCRYVGTNRMLACDYFERKEAD